MTDLNILHTKIVSDRSSDLELSHDELADEFAFAPYVDNKVPMIDLGCLEIPEEKEPMDKQNPPFDISNSNSSALIP